MLDVIFLTIYLHSTHVNIDTLLAFYSYIATVPDEVKSHLVQLVHYYYIEDWIQLILRPLGAPRKPRTQQEWWQATKHLLVALTAMHAWNFCHRDIRWDNVVVVNSSKNPTSQCWVLIDMEFSAVVGTPFTWGEGKPYRKPGATTCSTETDMYMLSYMLNSACQQSWEHEKSFASSLTRLQAVDALQKLSSG